MSTTLEPKWQSLKPLRGGSLGRILIRRVKSSHLRSDKSNMKQLSSPELAATYSAKCHLQQRSRHQLVHQLCADTVDWRLAHLTKMAILEKVISAGNNHNWELSPWNGICFLLFSLTHSLSLSFSLSLFLSLGANPMKLFRVNFTNGLTGLKNNPMKLIFTIFLAVIPHKIQVKCFKWNLFVGFTCILRGL